MAKEKVTNLFKDYDPMWEYVKGEGQWNNFITPDAEYDTWSTNLYGQEVEDLEPALQAYLDEAVEFLKEQGKEPEDLADLYKVKDGKKYINFKRKGYNGENTPPKLYNVTGEEITGELKQDPWGGSTIRVRAMIKPYFMPAKKQGRTLIPSIAGLSYQLLAVQIIENKQGNTQSGFVDESKGGDVAPFDADPDTTENGDY
jgi:hypothetical protein